MLGIVLQLEKSVFFLFFSSSDPCEELPRLHTLFSTFRHYPKRCYGTAMWCGCLICPILSRNFSVPWPRVWAVVQKCWRQNKEKSGTTHPPAQVCSVTSPFFLSRATNALYDNDVTETMKNIGMYAVLAFTAKALKEAQSLVYLRCGKSIQAYLFFCFFWSRGGCIWCIRNAL